MENILVAALLAEAFGMYLLDQRLRASRDSEVHEDSLGHPLRYWSKPELFTEGGNRVRVGLLALLWIMFLNIIALALVTA